MKMIEANALLNHLYNKQTERVDVALEIATFPTVEAEPVHYGHWIIINKGFDNWVECSECRTAGSPFWKRCPMCEAKMKGVENNAAD